jgi:hypothetical protein
LTQTGGHDQSHVVSVSISVQWDTRGIAGLETGKLKGAVRRALSKAGKTALRDMRSEASKRIKARKRIASKYISRALSLRAAKSGDIAGMSWALNVSGQPVPLIACPHSMVRGRAGKGAIGPRSQGGVAVEVNTGKRTLVRGAFLATMRSGHEGIFQRRGAARLPIHELLGSRPVDALLHPGEADAVAARGGRSFGDTFTRLLPLEIDKGTAKGGGA